MRGSPLAFVVVAAVAVAGCKRADAARVDAYVKAATRTAQLNDQLFEERCALSAKGKSWQAATDETHARYQEAARSGDASVAAYDALIKSEPPGDTLDQQARATQAGKVASDRREAFAKACQEKWGKGPDVEKARADLRVATAAYVKELEKIR